MILRRATIVFFSLFVLLNLFPLALVIFHLPVPRAMTAITTLTGFTFAFLHAARREGWTGALRFAALVFGVSLLFESVGVATGIVYGPYHYTDKLGPLFLGLVPYLIPVAWFMMSYPSYVIADKLVPAAWKPTARLFSIAAVGGLVMTAWDLVMDPLMVAGEHWVWEINGAYFGIPLQNFWGWWLTVFSTFALYGLFNLKKTRSASLPFDRLALAAYLAVMFSITFLWFGSGGGNFALIGFFAMAPWGVAGLLRSNNNIYKNAPQR